MLIINPPTQGRGLEATLPRVASAFVGGGIQLRCWVYVDGFNFYHGAARRTGHKWVDLLALARNLRPQDAVRRVKYFTAPVEKRTDDPDQQRRQRIYWRALETLGCVDRIEGRFRRGAKFLPLDESVQTLELLGKRGCNVAGIKPIMVKVLRSEEKATDVNLAAHLVHDAHQADPARTFEVALVLSTDADLAGAIRLVTQEVGKPVYVCKPNPNDRVDALKAAATGVFDLTTSVLRASLFPATLTDARGTFTKPSGW